MADLNSLDSVEHESTRVCAVETSISQATYDLYKWETEVFDDFDGNGTNFTIDSIVNTLGFPLYSNFYGGLDSNNHILHDPDLIQYRQDVDMLYHLSSDDPPLYIDNSSTATGPAQDVYHHSLHAKTLFDAAVVANLPEVIASVPHLSINNTLGETGREFLVRHLNSCSLVTNTDEENEEVRFQISPNPATSIIRIDGSSNLKISKVEIVNRSGKRVLEKQINQKSTFEVQTSSLNAGIYFIKISSKDGKHFTEKFIIE